MNYRALLCALFCLVGLSACNEDAKQPSSEAEVAKALHNDRPTADYVRQARSQIKEVEGFLQISDGFSVSILPLNSPWVIRCSFGNLGIAFGTSVSGANGDTSNDVSLSIPVPYSNERCGEVSLAVAKELQSIQNQQSGH